jgi:hypothetical protein
LAPRKEKELQEGIETDRELSAKRDKLGLKNKQNKQTKTCVSKLIS